MLANYYLGIESLDNMVINFECTPVRPIESLALACGVTWWAYALNMVGLYPKLGGMWQTIE